MELDATPVWLSVSAGDLIMLVQFRIDSAPSWSYIVGISKVGTTGGYGHTKSEIPTWLPVATNYGCFQCRTVALGIWDGKIHDAIPAVDRLGVCELEYGARRKRHDLVSWIPYIVLP